MVTSRSGPSVEVPFWVSPPMHKASLATYSLERLQLATSLISSCLTIKWRQHTFFGWFWRSNRRWADSTFTLSYLPYPTWESVLVSLVPRNQSSWHRGKKKKNSVGNGEDVCAACWVDSSYIEGRTRFNWMFLSQMLLVVFKNHIYAPSSPTIVLTFGSVDSVPPKVISMT